MQQHHLNRAHQVLSGSVVMVLIILFLSTDPTRVSIALLIVPLLLVLVLAFEATRALILLMKPDMPLHKRRSISVVSGIGAVMLLSLASLNQLTIKDVALSTLLILGVTWYFGRVNLLKE
jgi:hypothetical protein